jgi:hypothetical protein
MILGMRDGKHESLARGPGRSTLRLSSHATGPIAVYGGQMFEGGGPHDSTERSGKCHNRSGELVGKLMS